MKLGISVSISIIATDSLWRVLRLIRVLVKDKSLMESDFITRLDDARYQTPSIVE